MSKDFSVNSTMPESSIERARGVIAEQRIRNAAAAAADNPLSPEGQAGARVTQASTIANTLREHIQSVAGTGNYSTKGLAEVLAPAIGKAREEALKVKEQHAKAGEAILEQARAATAAPVLEYTDADARILQSLASLPEEQRNRVRMEALTGKQHPEVQRALLAAPQFVSQLDKRTRVRLEEKFNTTEPAKREAILARGRRPAYDGAGAGDLRGYHSRRVTGESVNG
jgi:hypothetical protein